MFGKCSCMTLHLRGRNVTAVIAIAYLLRKKKEWEEDYKQKLIFERKFSNWTKISFFVF